MSRSIDLIKDAGINGEDLAVTSFYGGADKGTMLQLSQDINSPEHVAGYVQLTHDSAEALIDVLINWMER